jgi:hypothetical protein
VTNTLVADSNVPDGTQLVGDSSFDEVLVDLDGFLRRYIVFPSPEHHLAVTLWVASTYVWRSAQFDALPYLAITSPEKGSGKTRLIEVLSLVVDRPWRTSMPSPSALYSKIEQDHPTLLLDEVDAVFLQHSDSSEALRGVLNVGNRRGGTVSRVQMTGQTRVVIEFDVFGPKALAGISSLPETLADRSIVIPLRRKTPEEIVEPLHMSKVRPEGERLRQRLRLALKDGVDPAWVSTFDGLNIDGLTDRQVEGWTPLLAIGAMAQAYVSIPTAMGAARTVSRVQKEADETAVGAKLLLHIRETLDTLGTDRVRTSDLLVTLRARDDGPWAEVFDSKWDEDNQKSAARLAKMLKPYGVKPSRPRFGGTNSGGDAGKGEQWPGYLRADFAEAWERWL